MRHPLHAVIRTWTRLALHVIAAFTAVSVAGMTAVTLLRAVAARPEPWTVAIATIAAAGAVVVAACSGERGAR